MSLGHGASIVRDGLVLHLDAANVKSYPGTGTTWSDLSGNGNNGTLTNGPTYTTTNKGEILFDGVNDYISFPTWGNMSGASGAGPITMETWLRIDDTPPNSAMGYLGFNSPTNFFKYMNTSNLFLDVYDTTSSSRVLLNTLITASNYFGQWVHLCGVSDGTTIKSYYNGNQIASLTLTLADLSSVNFAIGDGMGYYMFKGKNASCKLYNRSLSAEEIKQNFEALRGRYGI